MASSHVSLVKISKAMSYVLRHSQLASRDPNGWVSVPDLQRELKFRVTLDEIRTVVAENDKKRFVLDERVEPARVRATQGHTVQLEDPLLTEVTDPASVPFAVHVTSDASWATIKQSGELKRMKRTHIHFATLPSHMRRNSWANTLLVLDLEGAMAHGHKFYLSENNVLLTKGPLEVQFVKRAGGNDLPDGWT